MEKQTGVLMFFCAAFVLCAGCAGRAEAYGGGPSYPQGGMVDYPGGSYEALVESRGEGGNYYHANDVTGNFVVARKEASLPPSPPIPSPKQSEVATGDGGEWEVVMPDVVVKGRVIIYDAVMELAVFQVSDELERIRKKIREWGGYMVSMSTNYIIFRVPVERFDSVVDEVASYGEVISKRIASQDVTEEFRDLTIKLKNALAMRDRMIELLGKAKTVQESLLIEAELKRLLEEIELIKGRLKFLQESALYSRISVYLRAKEQYKRSIPKLPAPLQWLQYDFGLNALFE